ncbi:hypothetical protein [Geitlerinema sp. PCC 9228]|uniref:hypothetical protein n=1 Tax=Geitlerinema sp. PCC 9228 TaxID=111611 RepID=UPI001B8B09B1|nr:hypothetical protein [Geitlerinema sp. PCC 9228]
MKRFAMLTHPRQHSPQRAFSRPVVDVLATLRFQTTCAAATSRWVPLPQWGHEWVL